MLVLHQGKEKKVSILSDKFFEEQAFPYLLPTGKFGYNLTQDIPINPSILIKDCSTSTSTLHQMGIIYFSTRPVHGQHHLRSSMNFAIHKNKRGTLTTGTFQNNLKGTTERFVASDII